jgi:peroxiredoxin
MKVAGVRYLPIFRGYERPAVADFCASKGYTFPVGLDPHKAIYNLYATKSVPRTFLIDRQGVIRYIYVEYDLSTLDEILSLAEGLAR